MDATQKVLNQLNKRIQIQAPIADGMFVPNHSGDHSRGLVRETPTGDQSIANKKYVDDAAASIVSSYLSNHPHQDVNTTASPSFAGLTATGNVFINNSGVLRINKDAGGAGMMHIKSNDDATRALTFEVNSNSQTADLINFMSINSHSTAFNAVGNLIFDYDGTHGLRVGQQFAQGATDKWASVTTRGGVDEHLYLNAGRDNSNNNGDIVMQSDVTGNVGIGTSSPSEKLEVSGNIKASASAPYVLASNTGGNAKTIKLLADNSTDASYLKATTGVPSASPYSLKNSGASAMSATASSAAFPTSTGTISYWVYNLPSSSTYTYVKGTNATFVQILHQSSGVITFMANSTSVPQWNISSTAVSAGAWHHICARWTTNSAELWIDGAIAGTKDTTCSVNPTGTDYLHAIYNITKSSGNIYFDEYALWDRYLTDGEVGDLYASGAGLYLNTANNFASSGTPISTNLKTIWHLDNAATDSSGNGYSLTPTNTAYDPTIYKIVSPPADAEVQVIKVSDGVSSGANGTIEFGNTTSDTILKGGDLSFQISSTEYWNIVNAGDLISTNASLYVRADNEKVFFGAADDASLTYDGTNLVVNPKVVGTGSLYMDGRFDLRHGDDTRLVLGVNAGLGGVGNNSIFIGNTAGYTAGYTNTGTYNIGIGYWAMGRAQVGATYNIAIGDQALWGISGTAARNIAIGWNAGKYISAQSDNVLIGHVAGINSSTGTGRNTAVGASSLYTNQTGKYGTALGYATLYNSTGDNNVALGYGSGFSTSSGASNIFIGFSAGYYQTTESNQLLIDNQLRASKAVELTNSIIYGVMGATPNVQSIRFNVDDFIITAGDGYDPAITFGTGATNAGVLTWMEDEDYFKFSDDIFINDAENIILGTSTGTKIGTATSQKLSFYNSTPIIQPTTAVAEAAFVENAGGTAVNVDSTFGGYTIQQIVKALQNLGLLA